MKIFRCINTNLVTQGFGKEQTKLSLLPFYESLGLLGHNSVDFMAMCQNTQVKIGGKCESVFFDVDVRGIVCEIADDEKWGKGVRVITEDKDGIFKHSFWHLDSFKPSLKVGDIVGGGDFLGVAGNTGQSTGAHVDRNLKRMLRDANGEYYYPDYNNGYLGSISIEPYYVNMFILDYNFNLQTQISIMQKIINLWKKLLGL